jgi:hypothetical protein
VFAELLEVGNVSRAARDITKRVDVASLYRAIINEVRVSWHAILTVPLVVPLLEIPD